MGIMYQGSPGAVFGPAGANHAQGMVVDPGTIADTASTNRFLRSDASWDQIDYTSITGTPAIPTVYSVLLNTLTASTSTFLQDTTSLTNASYSAFELVFEHLVPTTSAVAFALCVHSNSAFQTSSYQSNVQGLYNTTITNSASGGGDILLSQVNVGTGAAGLNGQIRVYNPAAGTAIWVGQFAYPNTTGPYLQSAIVTGIWNGGATAIDGFQVFSGTRGTSTIASGTIKVYGIV